MIKKCIKCGKEYSCEETKRKYCSSVCYHKSTVGARPWNLGMKGVYTLPTRTGKYINCIVCGKEKYFELNQFKKRPCKYCSVKCARKDSRVTPKVCSTIYSVIKREWVSSTTCEDCGLEKKLDWANISGKYLFYRDDWKQLCRKCHIAFDKQKGDLAYINYTNKQ